MKHSQLIHHGKVETAFAQILERAAHLRHALGQVIEAYQIRRQRITDRSSLVKVALLLATGMAYSQDAGQLMPRFGETAKEFEARKKGLPSPTAAILPNSTTLVADASGHFFTETNVNGSRIRMMVDTGATAVSLTKEDAKRIGINPAPADFTISATTANGTVYVAPVLLREVAIGDILVRNVIAVVHRQNGLAHSLLGMSFLSKL